MLIRVLAGGLIAGFIVGLFAAVLHFAFVQDLILKAELYESGERVHFDAPAHAAGTAHSADQDHAPADDAGPLSRNLLTVLFSGFIYAGYGLMMAAAFEAVRGLGYKISATAGILWGLAGFATFQMAPSMGLSPDLPGTVAADITARQVWWFGAVAATGAGLALIAYGRTWPFVLPGLALIALPHVIGAPTLDTFYGLAPPEMAGEFATRVLGIGLAAWVVLGGLTARFTAPDSA